MKNYKYIIFIITIIGCNSISNESQIIETIQIRENQQVKLNDFIEEVEFIPLSKNIDIGLISKIVETKNFFILADLEFSFKILICDKKFNLISEINSYGEGLEEYLDIIDINFNEEKQLIEILTSKNFLQYNTNGNYVDSFNIPFFYIQSLIDISGNEYLTYSQNLELRFEIESDFLIKWNMENNEISTVSKHIKNMAVISTRDQNNMFKYNNAIYASHIYLDTIYVFENDEIKKIFLDFSKKNLPFSILLT